MKHITKFLFCISVFLLPVMGYAQTKIITGTVLDEMGDPVIGANVSVKETTTGIISDADGKFRLEVPSKGTLVISYIGFKTQELELGKTHYDVILREDFELLDEVVVVGYGTMKKSDLTGAVASVKSEELVTRPVANVMEALAGKVAGMLVGAVDQPGSTPSVRIRGERSIKAGNSPLYVVDGVPRSGISDIPVSEIETINVLKDAVSASIYGARGANGVIMITTKSGGLNQEKTSIEFDASFGVNSIKLPELMGGEDYITYRRNRALYELSDYGINWSTTEMPTDAQIFDANELYSVENGIFTDWRELLYKKSTISQEYNLSVTTSSQKSIARFSVGYRDDEGYYPTAGSKRLTLAARVDQQVFKFLKIGVNARYMNQIVNSVNPGRMMSTGTVTYNSLTYLNPLLRAYDEHGNLIENVTNIYANPLLDFAEGNTFLDKSTRHRLFGVFTSEFKILDGLTFNSNLGYELHNDYGDKFYSSNTTRRYLMRDSDGAYAEKSNTLYTNMTWDNILNYTKNFGKHSINGTGVFSVSKSENKKFSANGAGLPDDALGVWNLNELLYNKNMDSEYVKQTWVSYVGRFQYGYDDRYLLNVSVRTDGASVLAPGNKWATFPAASFAWVLHNEDFFQSDLLSILKLRLSYGKVGNAAIDPYETYAQAKIKRTNFGSEFATGYMLDKLKDKNLTWETSATVNLGVDWGLWNGRVNGYIEGYRTYTNNLLFERSVPYLSGTKNIVQNIGETSNIGLEIHVNSTNIRTKNFLWSTDINFATNKAKIEKLITDEDIPDNSLFIGEDWNIYYDNVLEGIWQVHEAEQAAEYSAKPGQQKVKDISGPDGVPDGSITSTFDRVILGKKNPKWTLYIRNQFSYKDFTVGFGLDGRFGHMIQMSGSGWSSSLPMKILNDYWTPDNPDGKYPLMALSTTQTMGGLWRLTEGSYVRVQEISAGYHFKLPYTHRLGVSFLASNPFYLWKKSKEAIDPSTGKSDWTVWKSFVFKLDYKF